MGLARHLWPFRSAETKAVTLTDESALALFGGMPTASGVNVTAYSAMKVPAVAAAVGLISESLGTLPLKVYSRASKALITDHPAHRIVAREANPWTSAGALRTALAFDALTRDGGGFALVTRLGDGRPAELHRLDPSKVMIETAADGEPSYIVQHGEGRARYSFEDVLHVQSLAGMCPITIAREAIGLALALESFAASLLANGARPGGIILAQKTLDVEAKRKIAASWVTTHGGSRNAGRTAILDEAMTYQQLGLSMMDMQWAEARTEQTREIARAFRIPAPMIGELGRATWSNLEQLNRQFLQATLSPWLRAFEAAFTRVLLTADERDSMRIEFVVDGLLETDAATRATALGQYRAMGALTGNEVRSLLNLPSHPAGDTLDNPHTTPGGATPPADEKDAA